MQRKSTKANNKRSSEMPSFSRLSVINPKRHADTSLERRLFPYYAGYSTEFTRQALRSADLKSDAVVLDPWNGAGTTTQVANVLGCNAIGMDLNPVMVVVAKAGLLSPREAPSLLPLAKSILDKAKQTSAEPQPDDPLGKWMDITGATLMRSVETTVNKTLVSHAVHKLLQTPSALKQLSPLAAFFYVALFRTVRCLLSDFVATNPTWIKTPRNPQARKRPRWESIEQAFLLEVATLTDYLRSMVTIVADEPRVSVLLGSSERIPLPAESADFVLTSPPYCTRIDYAVATAIELAILRFGSSSFDEVRRSLMGTSTVESLLPSVRKEWGPTCIRFLSKVRAHTSKASAGYYYKSHLQYFDSLYNSVVELHRVLKDPGRCLLVVQDSHYKEIHNDVPRVVTEMAQSVGLHPSGKKDFVADRSMVRMNAHAKKYLPARRHVESVIYFEKRALN